MCDRLIDKLTDARLRLRNYLALIASLHFAIVLLLFIFQDHFDYTQRISL